MAIDLGRTRFFMRDPQVEDGVNFQNKTTTEKCWHIVIWGWYGLIRGFFGFSRTHKIKGFKGLESDWSSDSTSHTRVKAAFLFFFSFQELTHCWFELRSVKICQEFGRWNDTKHRFDTGLPRCGGQWWAAMRAPNVDHCMWQKRPLYLLTWKWIWFSFSKQTGNSFLMKANLSLQ